MIDKPDCDDKGCVYTDAELEAMGFYQGGGDILQFPLLLEAAKAIIAQRPYGPFPKFELPDMRDRILETDSFTIPASHFRKGE